MFIGVSSYLVLLLRFAVKILVSRTTNGGREGRVLRCTEGGYHWHLQEFEGLPRSSRIFRNLFRPYDLIPFLCWKQLCMMRQFLSRFFYLLVNFVRAQLNLVFWVLFVWINLQFVAMDSRKGFICYIAWLWSALCLTLRLLACVCFIVQLSFCKLGCLFKRVRLRLVCTGWY